MAEILQCLKKYIIADEPNVSVLWGDGLSCDRVKDAIESRNNAKDESKRLLCFEPVPQDWHKRLHYVTVSLLYK